MAKPNSITRPQPSSPQRPHSDLLVAYLQVARTATDRALRAAEDPDLRHQIYRAHDLLSAAHGLLLSDRNWAA